jgi:hypothetical protein
MVELGLHPGTFDNHAVEEQEWLLKEVVDQGLVEALIQSSGFCPLDLVQAAAVLAPKVLHGCDELTAPLVRHDESAESIEIVIAGDARFVAKESATNYAIASRALLRHKRDNIGRP